MFVGVRDISEHGEKFNLRPLLSVVRLKLFNGSPFALRNERYVPHGVAAPATVFAPLIANGELRHFPSLKLADPLQEGQRQLEHNVVKAGSHVRHGVPNDQPPLGRQGLILAYRICRELLALVIGEGVWMLFKKPLGGLIEGI